MGRRAGVRRRLGRASLPALIAISALTLAACKEDPDDLAATNSESSPSAAPTDKGSGDGTSQDGGESPGSDPDSGTGSDDGTGSDGDTDPGDGGGGGSDGDTGDSGGTVDTSYAVDPPGPFQGLHRSDVLITATESLPDSMVERFRSVPGVESVLPISVGSASINGRTLTVAAVDAGKFRAFTPDATARADFVWERVAGGEVAVDNDVDKRLIDKNDMIQLGSDEDSPEVHVGAFAPLISSSVNLPDEKPVIQVVMNEKRGEQLGIQEQNALLIDTGLTAPSELKDQFEKILGDRGILDTLAIEFGDLGQSAVLTGQSVSDAVGTFTYTDNPDGTVNPDPAWVKEYIRTESVPILGTVTCNKGMLPQLRGALTEIQLAGLSDAIHPDEYAGCYYPRYINHDPSYGLSLHSWGIAVDLNVPGNQRGTAGEMDRGVVAIFKKWGFAWGGDWNYTDPMHFEMSKVVRAGGAG
jgi:hypothetical protein